MTCYEGDSIFLEGMAFYAFHGATDEERMVGGRYLVDLEVRLRLATAGGRDRLEDTVDYRALYGLVQEVMLGPPSTLLEFLAEEIARRVLTRFPQVEGVRVVVRKAPPPLPSGVLHSAGVQVVRRRCIK
ncbi:MAG: dihydroneopterin aldolase [Dehalococcoidia bacterium]|nr:dihydroneopterin aldolase [Dehalococcoidia bacterium]MDW8120678.1 dihydroneopterin aldolase [Chloroflexota bacterium]